MKPSEELGMVETIYEEEYENSSNSSFLSTPVSSPPIPLSCRVEAWSLASGHEADVLIRVKGSCFHLHKDPLTSTSNYFRRQIRDRSELTVSPPLKITPETFALVADFCYGAQIVLTPFNIAALRVAAELLGMTESDRDGSGNLRQITENYFSRVVAVNRELASIVFRSCLFLLPESETTAYLASRCVEALHLTDEDGAGVDYLDDVKSVCAENILVLADSMRRRFASHDLLYRIVDHYLEQNYGGMTEEQTSKICSSVDCEKLSRHVLLHSVQNPKMPLRFIVRAMLVEHLNTRRSMSVPPRPKTLGAILHRDAALRQVFQIKAAMDSTTHRIQTLERELNSMKKTLKDSEKERKINSNVIGSGRSASFRHARVSDSLQPEERESSILRSGRSASFSFGSNRRGEKAESPSISKNVAQRLMNGLKNAFRVSPKRRGERKKEEGVEGVRKSDEDDVCVTVVAGREGACFHRRTRTAV